MSYFIERLERKEEIRDVSNLVVIFKFRLLNMMDSIFIKFIVINLDLFDICKIMYIFMLFECCIFII